MSNIKLNYRVSGVAELNAKLNAMDKRMKGRIMTEALKKAMEPVKQLAISRAPVDRGLLRRSIKILSARLRSRFLKGAAVVTGTRKQLKIDENSKYYYPAALEYGTEHIVARSFMRSSLADRRSQALGILSTELDRILRALK